MQAWEYRVLEWQTDNYGRQVWSDTAGGWEKVSHHSTWVPVLDEVGEEGWELSGRGGCGWER